MIDKIEKGLLKIESVIIVTVFLCIFAVLMFQVIMRYCLGTPLVWSEEFARYAFTWICMIGVGGLVTKDAHIKMELLFTKFPAAVQKGLTILIYLVIFAALVYLLPPSLRQMVSRHARKSSAMRLPMSVLFAAFPCCSILTLIHIGLKLLKLVRGGEA